MRLVGRAVPLVEVGNAEMRRQNNMSAHASIVRAPSRKPYELFFLVEELSRLFKVMYIAHVASLICHNALL